MKVQGANGHTGRDELTGVVMPKYLIRRTVPGVGQMDAEQLRGLAAQSNKVLDKLGTEIQWVQSYVEANELVCVYNARDEVLIHEHARLGGFPCDTVTPGGGNHRSGHRRQVIWGMLPTAYYDSRICIM